MRRGLRLSDNRAATRPTQAQPSIDLAEQQQPPVARDARAVEHHVDVALGVDVEAEIGETVCRRHGDLVGGFATPRTPAPAPKFPLLDEVTPRTDALGRELSGLNRRA